MDYSKLWKGLELHDTLNSKEKRTGDFDDFDDFKIVMKKIEKKIIDAPLNKRLSPYKNNKKMWKYIYYKRFTHIKIWGILK